jgi:hypothetical protein
LAAKREQHKRALSPSSLEFNRRTANNDTMTTKTVLNFGGGKCPAGDQNARRSTDRLVLGALTSFVASALYSWCS